MLEKEFHYYLDHKDELITKYRGRFIVVAGETVIGDFASTEEAFANAASKYTAGAFLIQECVPGAEEIPFSIHRVTGFVT